MERNEIIRLLKAEGPLQQDLFERAMKVRTEYFGDEVVLRGAVEISSYCQKSCGYCAIRNPNKKLDRFRLTKEDILSIASEMRSVNISKIFIQSGQDPEIDEYLPDVISSIVANLGMEVILCLGERSEASYKSYAEAGAMGYVLKFETSDDELYNSISHASHSKRIACIDWIRKYGMKVGTGNIIGLPGQTLESIANDAVYAEKLHPDFVSTSPFIPNDGTPLENYPQGSINTTLNMMAILRIMIGGALIPTVSALEKIEKGGQLMGFKAGANVITINFTPTKYRDNYPIYAKQRFVVSLEHALNVVRSAGLRIKTDN